MNEERVKKLLRSAHKYTAYRERAPQEVRDRLADWDATPDEIEYILADLIKGNFVDEERFARAFCHDKFLIYKWGKRKISMEIHKYQLPSTVVTQGLNYINAVEYDKVLAQLAQAKWHKVRDADVLKKKQKTVAFLMQKGYEPDLIWAQIELLAVTEES